jgi:serine/threonine protein kinase
MRSEPTPEEEKIEILKKPIIRVPQKMSIASFKPNGKLLNDAEIQAIKGNKPGKYKKTQGDTPGTGNYSVVIVEKNGKKSYFAIYKGHVGKGGFGKVRLAQDLETGIIYAVKFQTATHDSRKEFRILKRIKKTPGATTRQKEPKDDTIKPYPQDIVIMDLAHGEDLFEFVTAGNVLTTNQWIDLARQLIESIQALHAKGILHCDIKLENFIYDFLTHKVTAIDVGMGLKAPQTIAPPQGTPLMAATEIRAEWTKEKNKRQPITYNEKTEIYSLGLSIACCLGLIRPVETPKAELNKIPAHSQKHYTHYYQFRKPDAPGNEAIFKIPNDDLRLQILDYLKKMTASNPDDRPTMSNAKQFFQALQATLNMNADRANRVGIIDVSQMNTIHDLKPFVKTMQLLDSVVLVDSTGQTSPTKLMRMRQLLEKANIRVEENCFSSASPLVDQAAEFISKAIHQMDDTGKNSYFYLNLQDEAIKLDPEVCVLTKSNKFLHHLLVHKDAADAEIQQLFHSALTAAIPADRLDIITECDPIVLQRGIPNIEKLLTYLEPFPLPEIAFVFANMDDSTLAFYFKDTKAIKTIFDAEDHNSLHHFQTYLILKWYAQKANLPFPDYGKKDQPKSLSLTDILDGVNIFLADNNRLGLLSNILAMPNVKIKPSSCEELLYFLRVLNMPIKTLLETCKDLILPTEGAGIIQTPSDFSWLCSELESQGVATSDIYPIFSDRLFATETTRGLSPWKPEDLSQFLSVIFKENYLNSLLDEGVDSRKPETTAFLIRFQEQLFSGKMRFDDINQQREMINTLCILRPEAATPLMDVLLPACENEHHKPVTFLKALQELSQTEYYLIKKQNSWQMNDNKIGYVLNNTGINKGELVFSTSGTQQEFIKLSPEKLYEIEHTLRPPTDKPRSLTRDDLKKIAKSTQRLSELTNHDSMRIARILHADANTPLYRITTLLEKLLAQPGGILGARKQSTAHTTMANPSRFFLPTPPKTKPIKAPIHSTGRKYSRRESKK